MARSSMRKVRVKRRYGRLYRPFGLNTIRAKFVNPIYQDYFSLQVDRELINEAKIPLEDTPNIAELLNDIKEKVSYILRSLISTR